MIMNRTVSDALIALLPILVDYVNARHALAKILVKMAPLVRISLPDNINVFVHLGLQEMIAQSELSEGIAIFANVKTEELALSGSMGTTASVHHSSQDHIVELTSVPIVTSTRTAFTDAVAAGEVILGLGMSALRLKRSRVVVFVLFIINVCRECAFAYLDLSAETTDPVLETVLQRIYMMMSNQQDSPRRKSTLVHTKLSSVAIKIIYSYWVVFSSVACSLSFMCLILCHCVCS